MSIFWQQNKIMQFISHTEELIFWNHTKVLKQKDEYLRVSLVVGCALLYADMDPVPESVDPRAGHLVRSQSAWTAWPMLPPDRDALGGLCLRVFRSNIMWRIFSILSILYTKVGFNTSLDVDIPVEIIGSNYEYECLVR